MAELIDTLTKARQKVRKGRHAILIAPISTPAPTVIEDVIVPGTWTLKTGYTFWGETTKDGATVAADITRDQGTESDQSRSAFAKGAVLNQNWTLNFTSLYTSLAELSKSWHMQAVTAIAAVTGATPNVAQSRARIGVPDALLPMRIVVLQQNRIVPTNGTRGLLDMLWFPYGTLLGEGVTLGGDDARTQAIGVELEEDTTNAYYGLFFEETPPA